MRVEKLRNLLGSIERFDLETVYVADDGKTTDAKEALYANDYEFDLTVFNLEYDAGVGEKRYVLASEVEEPYLLFADSDMEIPSNYRTLYHQLEKQPDVGGIAPMYLEDGRISTVSTDLYEDGRTLVRDIREPKTIEMVADAPFVEFDFLPQVGLFRKECVVDYNWDRNYTIGMEHDDFFVGHWKRTNWKFGLSPQVLIPHYPGGSQEYISHRHSRQKLRTSDEYFCEKWGYRRFKVETDRWVDTYDPERGDFPSLSTWSNIVNLYRSEGAVSVIKRGISTALQNIKLM